MTIYEYGDRAKPHILLIHGMWMCHEMMLPYVEKMRSEYHIIAPDLTGHGSDMGSFEGAEKDAIQIGKWLTVKCSVLEGAALTRMKGVEWMFRGMMGGMQKHPEAVAKMYSAADIDSDVMKKLSGSMSRTDKKALACMVHTCNSFKYEQSMLPADMQRRLFLSSAVGIHTLCAES